MRRSSTLADARGRGRGWRRHAPVRGGATAGLRRRGVAAGVVKCTFGLIPLALPMWPNPEARGSEQVWIDLQLNLLRPVNQLQPGG